MDSSERMRIIMGCDTDGPEKRTYQCDASLPGGTARFQRIGRDSAGHAVT